MAKLPEPHQMPTLDAVAAAMEAAQDSTTRPYLGLSQLGHPCTRNLFYSFHWAERSSIPASGLRAIEDGHAGEAVMALRLRMVKGIELHTEGPDGSQFGFSSHGGHVKGHMDGAIHGLVEAPKTWHVWEHKQVNEAKFKKLVKLIDSKGEKNALAAWDEVYFGQAISYMGMSGMDRHFLTVGTPGGRDYISVRTEFDKDRFDHLMSRAEKIITATEPPLRLSDDPEYFECKWCRFHGQCHGTKAPEVNCRTCTHSTPQIDGTEAAWTCGLSTPLQVIPIKVQRTGCDSHRFVPPMLERLGKPVDIDGDLIVYAMEDGTQFANGTPPDGFTSAEIRAADGPGMLRDRQVRELREEFPTARIVPSADPKSIATAFDDMPSDTPWEAA